MSETSALSHFNPWGGKTKAGCVVGVPDDYRGETVRAFVVPVPGSSLEKDAVVSFCR